MEFCNEKAEGCAEKTDYLPSQSQLKLRRLTR